MVELLTPIKKFAPAKTVSLETTVKLVCTFSILIGAVVIIIDLSNNIREILGNSFYNVTK